MAYRKKRTGHYMPMSAVVFGMERYAVCELPGCMRVVRGWKMKPLIHKGGRPRR